MFVDSRIQNRHLERINAKSTKVDDEVRGRHARFLFTVAILLTIHRLPSIEPVWTVFIDCFIPALLALVSILLLRLLPGTGHNRPQKIGRPTPSISKITSPREAIKVHGSFFGNSRGDISV